MFLLRRYARRPSPSMVVAVIALLLASGGVAYAQIPDSDTGVIDGCYANRTGALRVIDTEANPDETCTTKEMELDWNQTGTAGADGVDGAPGAAGAAGAAGPNFILGSSRGKPLAANAFTYVGISTADSELLKAQQVAAVSGTYTKLLCVVGTSPGSDSRVLFIVRRLNSLSLPNPPACSVAAGSTVGVSIAGSVTFTAGEQFVLEALNTGTTAITNGVTWALAP